MKPRADVRRVARLLAGSALIAVLIAAPAVAQTVSAPPAEKPVPSSAITAQAAEPDQVTDLTRIRQGLNRPTIIRVRQEGVRFYLTVLGERLTIHDYMRNSDLKYAPVPGAGVTHQDFLNHITPKYLYSSGGIKAAELLEWGLVNWLGQMAVKKIINKLGDTLQDAEVRRIREQIDRELAALRGGK